MSGLYQDVLFYVFIGFFILIGLISLSALLGYPRVDKATRKWALSGFTVGIASGVFALFRVTFLTPAAPAAPQLVLAPINVTLTAAPEMPPATVLTSGKYVYDEQTDEKRVVTQEGAIVPVRGIVGNSWTVKLPGSVADKPTQLYLQDETGGSWVVEKFFPNSLNLQIKAGKPLPLKPSLAAVPSWRPFRMPVVSAAELSSAMTQEQAAIKFNNSSRSIGDRNGRAYYEWRVYVDEPPQVLQTIARVDYVLHPTFPDPFQTSANRDKAFELTASGWGGFTILITVHYVDGREAKTSYFLDLQKTDHSQVAIDLTLASIEVEWDGSTGTTGWSFEVFVDGESSFKLPNRKYEDGRGKSHRNNLYLPDTEGSLSKSVTLAAGRPLRIEIKGKRSFPPFFGDIVSGAGNLNVGDGSLTVHVSDQGDPEDGSFVFLFLATHRQAP